MKYQARFTVKLQSLFTCLYTVIIWHRTALSEFLEAVFFYNIILKNEISIYEQPNSFTWKYSILLPTFCVQHNYSFNLFTVNDAYYSSGVEILSHIGRNNKNDALKAPEVGLVK